MKETKILNDIGIVYHWMRKILKDCDTSGLNLPLNKTQERVIVMIYKHPRNTMSMICNCVGLEKGSFTGVVDTLMSLGYITRERSDNDRRKISLSLTKKGEDIAIAVEEEMYKELKKVIYQYGEDEGQILIDSISKIAEFARRKAGYDKEKKDE